MRIIRAILRRLRPAPSPFTNRQPEYAGYEIGDWTYGKPIILDWKVGAKLRIGKYCSIARDVRILVGGEHYLDWVTTYPFLELWGDSNQSEQGKTSKSKGDVVIGNDVWIGTGAIILSGVHIHDGAVIGAGSVVTKEVTPYSIVAGNPARLLRNRFDSSTTASLQRIEWWNWSPEAVRSAWPLLMGGDIQAFIQKYSEHP